jgi:hypothetical protein
MEVLLYLFLRVDLLVCMRQIAWNKNINLKFKIGKLAQIKMKSQRSLVRKLTLGFEKGEILWEK